MSKERDAYTFWYENLCKDKPYADEPSFSAGFQAATAHYQPLLVEKDAEIARLQDESESGKRALQFLDMQGYRKCNISACNCPFWHGGNASERLSEIHDVLNDAGAKPYEKTAIKAIEDIIDENTALKALLVQARERLVASNYLLSVAVNDGTADGFVSTAGATTRLNEKLMTAINAATGKGE